MQRLQSLLEAAQQDNQRMQQEMETLRKEADTAKASTNVAPPLPHGLVAELQTKLKEAEGRATAESQLTEWKERWKAAVEKVGALENRLAETMREFEAHKAQVAEQQAATEEKTPLPGSGGATPQPGLKRKLMMLAGMMTMAGGAGGFGLDRMIIPSPSNLQAKISQLTSQVTGQVQNIKDLTTQLTTVNHQAAQIAADLTQETTKRKNVEAERDKAASDASRNSGAAATLASLKNQYPLLAYSGRTKGTLVWQGDVKTDKGVDIAIDQGLGVQANDHDVVSEGITGDFLPKVPVVVQPAAKNVYIVEPPNPANRWDRVVFHIEKRGRTKVQLNWTVAR